MSFFEHAFFKNITAHLSRHFIDGSWQFSTEYRQRPGIQVRTGHKQTAQAAKTSRLFIPFTRVCFLLIRCHHLYCGFRFWHEELLNYQYISFNPHRTIGDSGAKYIKPEQMYRVKREIMDTKTVLFPEYWQVNYLIYAFKITIQSDHLASCETLAHEFGHPFFPVRKS